MAAPPSSAASNSKACPKRAATALEHAHGLGRDLAADAVAGKNCNQRLHLGSAPRARRFVTFDVGQLAAQEAELIDAVQQAVAREGFQRE